MRYFVIVNPTSGRGLGGRSLPQIRKRFEQEGKDFTLVETTRQGHARQLAEQAALDGYDAVVCCSGDGTINETINGLVAAAQKGAQKTIFGVIAIGTGNDFAGGAGIATTLDASLDILMAGHTKVIDMGFVKGGDYPEGRYFGNGIGMGLDAAVGTQAEKIRWTRGLLAYLIGLLQTVFMYYDPPKVRIDIDGKVIEQYSLMVSVMNGRRMGGGFVMTPTSKIDDGLFDLCIAEAPSQWRILQLIPYFLKGTQEGQKEILLTQGKKVRVEALTGEFPCHADGEWISKHATLIEAEMLPASLTIFA